MRRIAVVLAFTLAFGAPAPARAQVPEGSTTLTGQPDSLFNAFLTFLKVHGDSAIAIDPRRRTVKAHVKESDEPIVFRFETRGDSTTVTAQPTKGGMTALIFGLGVVDDWLHGRAKGDSTHRGSGPTSA